MAAQNTRQEKDFVGFKDIPINALYGIHSMRARENFPDTTIFQPEWYEAIGSVKKACYITAGNFFEKALERTDISPTQIRSIDKKILHSLIHAAEEVENGEHYNAFIVPALSGGAGTSINMNVNEIIANRALQILGENPGNYSLIDPIEHANIFQSTNDVVPTSLKLTILNLLVKLEESINTLRGNIETLEKKHLHDLRKSYTQMQEAVPSSFGRLFSTYNDALSRDWWRISKCFERIKVVNLGGSAIGSGITVPRYFIMEVTRVLQENTQLPVTRGENLFDATNNLDSLVEVHGILKAHAVNLEKMVSDLRLLSSDLVGSKEIEIPKKQIGSSIMPGKVNPVIAEFVISCSHKVYSNDVLITSLSAQGCLELNAYIPAIGHALIESLKLLIACSNTLQENLISGIKINSEKALQNLFTSPSITTVLVPFIGYNKAAEMARYMQENKTDIFVTNNLLKILNEEQLIRLLTTENILKEGFTLNDIINT